MLEEFGPEDEWWCWLASDGAPGECFGPIAGHELLKRSRGGSITDMSNVVLACQYHNGWVEDNPQEAHQFGWAVHSWERDD
jgi:hypothetical protein